MATQGNDSYFGAFQTRLRSLLMEKNTTITALAKELGVTRQAVSQYCDGKVKPNVDKLSLIVNYFGVSADWILGRDGAVKSTNADIQKAGKYTGLNDESLTLLHGISEAIQSNPFSPAAKRGEVFLYSINAIIGSKEFQRILDRIWSAYCIKHQRALGGFAPKYPDEEEAKRRVDEIKSEFNSLADFGATSERIVSGDIAISVLLDDARDAIVSIAREIVNADIIEPQEGAVENG